MLWVQVDFALLGACKKIAAPGEDESLISLE
jgi:hypothetical protein